MQTNDREQPVEAPPWAWASHLLMVFSAPVVGALLYWRIFLWWMGDRLNDESTGWFQPYILVFAVSIVVVLGASVGLASTCWLLIARRYITVEQAWDVVRDRSGNKLYRWLSQYDRRFVEFIFRRKEVDR